MTETCPATHASLPEVLLWGLRWEPCPLEPTVKTKQLLCTPLLVLAFVCVDLIHSEQEQDTACPVGASPASLGIAVKGGGMPNQLR